jgi:hypothetical protein
MAPVMTTVEMKSSRVATNLSGMLSRAIPPGLITTILQDLLSVLATCGITASTAKTYVKHHPLIVQHTVNQKCSPYADSLNELDAFRASIMDEEAITTQQEWTMLFQGK